MASRNRNEHVESVHADFRLESWRLKPWLRCSKCRRQCKVLLHPRHVLRPRVRTVLDHHDCCPTSRTASVNSTNRRWWNQASAIVQF